jgi:hypothetical protein
MKKAVSLAIMCLLAALAFTQTLTLKEKQAIAGLDFSYSENRILESYGSAVPIVLDAPSFAGDMDAIMFADSRGALWVGNAFSRICDDKLGKEAMVDKKITKVVLKNDPKNKPKVTIDKGIMTVSIGFSTEDSYFSESEMREAIENLL